MPAGGPLAGATDLEHRLRLGSGRVPRQGMHEKNHGGHSSTSPRLYSAAKYSVWGSVRGAVAPALGKHDFHHAAYSFVKLNGFVHGQHQETGSQEPPILRPVGGRRSVAILQPTTNSSRAARSSRKVLKKVGTLVSLLRSKKASNFFAVVEFALRTRRINAYCVHYQEETHNES